MQLSSRLTQPDTSVKCRGAAVFCVRGSLTLVILALMTSPPSLAQQVTDVSFQIEEELEIGSYVGNVVEASRPSWPYTPDVLSSLQFRFIKQQHASRFHLDEQSGEMTTNERIDRDALCPGAEACTLRLDIAVQPAQYFSIIRVSINITDVNDNAPRFLDSELVFDVLETAVTGTGLVIPNALDPDGRRLAIHAYRIIKDRDVSFDLKEFRKPDDTAELRLILTRPLDREVRAEYRMRVEAVDGGVPPRTGSVDIHINVVDVNDHSPVFEKDSYRVTIVENTPLYTTILTVRASDGDVGLNAKIVYEFNSLTLTNHGTLFAIRNSTGEIYVNGVVDYEAGNVYPLVVVARDMGPDSMPGTVTVTVNVLDANDNAPEITVDTLSRVQGVAEASEAADVGTFVAHVSIADKDSGQNALFNCTTNDPHFTLKKIYGSEYQIMTAAELDREKKERYELAVLCTDSGEDPQASVEHVVVRVSDVNDNSPVFHQPLYTGDVIENNYVGMVVLYLNATDRDSGPNSRLTYTLEGLWASSFELDLPTGALRAMVALDHETVARVRLRVVARDGGVPSRTGEAEVDINVVDVNDERPQFTQLGYSFRVLENEAAGTSVGSVTAHDGDSGSHGHVTYSLLFDPSSQESFRIDPLSGVITTALALDRESRSSHELTVVASDQGVPPLTAAVPVSVTVLDVNDNGPEFPASLRANNSFYVSTVAPRGYVITRQRATDRDTGANAAIVYELFSDQHATDLFAVNSDMGTLSVTGSLADLDGVTFELKMTARDGGTPTRFAYAFLYINVNSSASMVGGGYEGRHQPAAEFHQNLAIVVSVAVVSSLITVVLITAIVLLRRQDRRRRQPKGAETAATAAAAAAAQAAEMQGRHMEPLKVMPKNMSAMTSVGQGSYLDDDVDDDVMSKEIVYSKCHVDAAGCNGTVVYPRGGTERGKPYASINNQNPIIHGVLSTFNGGGGKSVPAPPYVEGHPGGRGGNGGAGGALQNVYQQSPAHLSYQPLRQCPVLGQSNHTTRPEPEVHHLLQQLKAADADGASVHSAEGSNTDSGQGASEPEGAQAGAAAALDPSALAATHGKHATGFNSGHSNFLTTVPEENNLFSLPTGRINGCHGHDNQRPSANITPKYRPQSDRLSKPGNQSAATPCRGSSHSPTGLDVTGGAPGDNWRKPDDNWCPGGQASVRGTGFPQGGRATPPWRAVKFAPPAGESNHAPRPPSRGARVGEYGGGQRGRDCETMLLSNYHPPGAGGRGRQGEGSGGAEPGRGEPQVFNGVRLSTV